jgi:putative transposase
MKKASKKVSRLQRKVTNQRQDWTHKVASVLVSGNSLIATEDLNLKGMTRKAKKAVKEGSKNGIKPFDVGCWNRKSDQSYQVQVARSWRVSSIGSYKNR